MSQAALLCAERAQFAKLFEIWFLAHDQVQVQAQPGFQAQPGLQQVQVEVLSGYSTFWPENHLKW